MFGWNALKVSFQMKTIDLLEIQYYESKRGSVQTTCSFRRCKQLNNAKKKPLEKGAFLYFDKDSTV